MRSSGPRSYDVELEDGRVMRRNRQHLLLTRESYQPSNGLTPKPPALMDATQVVGTPGPPLSSELHTSPRRESTPRCMRVAREDARAQISGEGKNASEAIRFVVVHLTHRAE